MWDFNKKTLWKTQNYGNDKRINGCQELRRKKR